MPDMPAFCGNCGLVFNSGFFFENCINISLQGNNVSCPSCGSMTSIPDGLYNFIDSSIELLKGPEITIYRLKELKNIISELRKQKASFSGIKETIEKEVPELNSIIGTLPKTRTELYAFLALLIAAITLLLNQCEKNEDKNITIHNTVNQYNEIYSPKTKEIKNDSLNSKTFTYNGTDPKKLNNKKIGRNEKCPCGSGEKYKKCHGKITNHN